MLVADLRERITVEEYVGWSVYYARKAQRQEMAAIRAKKK